MRVTRTLHVNWIEMFTSTLTENGSAALKKTHGTKQTFLTRKGEKLLRLSKDLEQPAKCVPLTHPKRGVYRIKTLCSILLTRRPPEENYHDYKSAVFCILAMFFSANTYTAIFHF